ncbi:hypothetical protein DIURU_002826 [Diutina rugosa]|uniref:Transcription initiation factor IIF subunit alpha n=1 Tax=Diutina rugosa TaxID=5481 RepID=A0A642UND4_DIURU|nr:uncharacterized protein DIURU_002826 [Diutina rugosa]KAA8902372.1 hypothetical protein DIURU_002826 [Diutina rugosa]
MSQSHQSNNNDGSEWQEIPLECCSSAELMDTRCHIMKFQNNKTVDIVKDFTKPVRLHRKDPRNIQFQLSRKEIDERARANPDEKVLEEVPEEMDVSQVAPDGGGRRKQRNFFKRKTRQVTVMDEEKRKLRYEEFYPWVIEDYDARNVFVGNYEAGSSDSQHVLFVFDKDGFKMVPAEKVYRFTPRNKYATLTLEEAEEKMENRGAVPRWLMKRLGDENQQSTDKRFVKGTSPSSTSIRMRTVSGETANSRDSDHDDLDFDEEFADDEEAPIMDGDEEENKLSEQKIKKEMLKANAFDEMEGVDDLFGESEDERKVDKEGRKLKKVLTKTEGAVYESDEDDNPYLSKSDLESDSDDETMVKQEPTDAMMTGGESARPRVVFGHNLGDGIFSIRATPQILRAFPQGQWSSVGRRLPSIAEVMKNRENSPTPIDLNSAGPDNKLVTIKEVLDIVRGNPLTTKELLTGLKSRVNAHKDNKQRIIAIVKQNLKLQDGKLVLREGM